jgi:hypothetical protein
VEINIKIRSAENGYIVAIDSSIFSKGKEYIAKNKADIQSIIVSDIELKESNTK